jgi:hypothetical protein
MFMTQTEAHQQTAPTPEYEVQELSLSTTFELLKNRRRRETILYLLSHEETSTLSDLAEHIAAMENDIEIIELSSDQRKRVYIGLYQCHLPKLDKAGVVDFDKNRGTVVLNTQVTDQLVPYLEGDHTTSQEPEPTTPAPEVEPTEDDLPVTAGIAAVVGLLAVVTLVPLLGIGTALPAGIGLLAGLCLLFGVRLARERTSIAEFSESPTDQSE